MKTKTTTTYMMNLRAKILARFMDEINCIAV
jgi:hypothetical protein